MRANAQLRWRFSKLSASESNECRSTAINKAPAEFADSASGMLAIVRVPVPVPVRDHPLWSGTGTRTFEKYEDARCRFSDPIRDIA
jgi:hypothetical protein